MTTAPDEIAELKARIAQLEAKNAALEKQLSDAKAKTEYLDSSGKPHKRMSETAEKMLVMIAESQQPPFKSQIVGSLGLGKAKGDLFSDELFRHRVIDRTYTKADGDHNCMSNATGRAYLAAVGLL